MSHKPNSLAHLLAVFLVAASLWGCSDDVDGGELDANIPADVDAGSERDTSDDLDADVGNNTDPDSDGPVDADDDIDLDAGEDAEMDTTGPVDTGEDAETDTNDSVDTGADAGSDTGADAGTPQGDCISGASGTHAIRFRWDGSGSGSTAYAVYEQNELPDISRWRVGAYSSNIGYSPVFSDVFLGEGGLEMSGTIFMDVELSTAGLSSINNATIALYGRSYNTTSSGSFTWQTFSGTGATPSGYIANSAPYEWYGADAIAALAAGDDSILLRIRPGPPSNSLVVNRVEICFDAS